jgi:hypothetical protein
MQTRPTFAAVFVRKAYQTLLRLYPNGFRGQFEQEMSEVFEQALAENLQQSSVLALGFLVHEVIDAPGCIAREHIAARAGGYGVPFQASHPRLWSSLVGALAFGMGFAVLGFTDVLRETYGYPATEGLHILGILCAGGFGGLGLGWVMDERRKSLFALWGAVGFVFAQIFVNAVYTGIFPNALSTPAENWQDFLIAFLYPLGTGCVFGLLVGAASPHKKCRLPLMVSGGLALMGGFFLNRLSAALMLSYLLPVSAGAFLTPSGGWSLIVYILVPYLLEGALLGALLGSTARRLGLAPSEQAGYIVSG